MTTVAGKVLMDTGNQSGTLIPQYSPQLAVEHQRMIRKMISRAL